MIFQTMSSESTFPSQRTNDIQEMPALVVDRMSKEYLIGKSSLSLLSKSSSSDHLDKIVALNDISFELFKGDVIGVIGNNGSGKSTLIKVISGITKPTSGRVLTNGRVASILEIGTGFHPDLSGKDNVYLSGAIHGMTTAEIDSVYDDIVMFSGLKSFMSIPIKRYSSGMNMRLAFAIIAHLNADLILLDEVFSVGDAEFKKRSRKRVLEMTSSQKTILVVTHDLNSLPAFCHKALWLEEGRLKFLGPVAEVINEYSKQTIFQELGSVANSKKESSIIPANQERAENTQQQETTKKPFGTNTETEPETLEVVTFERLKQWSGIKRPGNEFVSIDELQLIQTPEKGVISCNDPLQVRLRYTCHTDVQAVPILLFQYGLSASAFSINPFYSQSENAELQELWKANCSKEIIFSIPNNFLNYGIYGVSVHFLDANKMSLITTEILIYFEVAYEPSFLQDFGDTGKYNAPIKPQFKWRLTVAH